jgi:hypothetical protein
VGGAEALIALRARRIRETDALVRAAIEQALHALGERA